MSDATSEFLPSPPLPPELTLAFRPVEDPPAVPPDGNLCHWLYGMSYEIFEEDYGCMAMDGERFEGKHGFAVSKDREQWSLHPHTRDHGDGGDVFLSVDITCGRHLAGRLMVCFHGGCHVLEFERIGGYYAGFIIPRLLIEMLVKQGGRLVLLSPSEAELLYVTR